MTIYAAVVITIKDLLVENGIYIVRYTNGHIDFKYIINSAHIGFGSIVVADGVIRAGFREFPLYDPSCIDDLLKYIKVGLSGDG